MPSLTDDLIAKTPEGMKKSAELTAKALKEAKGDLKEAGSAVKSVVKGICLLIKDVSGFTVDAVMSATKKVAFKKTEDIQFSKNNIDINILKQSGYVRRIEENVLKDTMKYFDQECKRFGVKYSAMIDTRGEDKPGYKPSYMVFFEGKDTELILSVLQEAYKDYVKDQERAKEAEKSRLENDRTTENPAKDKGKKRQEDKKQPEERESVKAKLAFFRDRVAARDKERDVVEKHHQHTDIQR